MKRRYIRLIATVTAFALLAGLAACGKTPAPEKPTDEAGPGAELASSVFADAPSPVEGHALKLAVCPGMKPYPDYEQLGPEGYNDAYDAWFADVRRLADQLQGYADGFDRFVENSLPVFLSGDDGENRVFSPLSLYLALGMCAELAEGQTRQQILDALGAEDLEALRRDANSLWLANYRDDGVAKSVLASSLWANERVPVRQEAVKRLAETYYASTFSGDPADPDYTRALRLWLSRQTDGLLDDFVSGITMDPQMILKLVQTVDYSAGWISKFAREDTEPGVFHGALSDVTADFMYQKRLGGVLDGDGFRAIALDTEYNGRMLLILPDEGVSPESLAERSDVRALIADPSPVDNARWVETMLYLPRFDVSSGSDAAGKLRALGITDAFLPEKADFSALTEAPDGVYIDQVEHDVRVTANEDGCRAAAMTVMGFAGAAMPQDTVTLRFDRPFLFAIVGNNAQTLFAGVVNTPNAA